MRCEKAATPITPAIFVAVETTWPPLSAPKNSNCPAWKDEHTKPTRCRISQEANPGDTSARDLSALAGLVLTASIAPFSEACIALRSIFIDRLALCRRGPVSGEVIVASGDHFPLLPVLPLLPARRAASPRWGGRVNIFLLRQSESSANISTRSNRMEAICPHPNACGEKMGCTPRAGSCRLWRMPSCPSTREMSCNTIMLSLEFAIQQPAILPDSRFRGIAPHNLC